MNQFRMDPARVRDVVGRLSAIADNAHRDLSQLRAALDLAGACWGTDEPGRTIGDTYLPEATKALTGMRVVADNIRALGNGIAGFSRQVQQQDQQSAWYLQHAQNGPSVDAGTGPHIGPLYDGTPQYVTPVGGAVSPQVSGGVEPGVGAQGDPKPVRSGGNPATHRPQAESPSVTTPQPVSSTARPTAWPPSVSVPDSQRGANNPSRPNSPADMPRVVSPSIATGPGATAAGVPTDPGPRGSSPLQPDKVGSSAAPWQPEAGKADNPWSRPNVTAGTDTGAPRSMPRGQFPTGATPPNLGEHPMALPPRRAKPRRYQPVSAHGAESPAVAGLRELAERHGLRLIGFDDPAFDSTTLAELVSAVDSMLGKYPCLALGGLEITDIPATVSRVVVRRTEETGPRQAWIMLDRACLVDRGQLEHRVAHTHRPGRQIAEISQRPMYSTILTDFGRIMVHTAGPDAVRKARRRLIAGAPGDGKGRRTLARVIAAYRRWLNPLWDSASDGPFDPRQALVTAFAETELCGRAASVPARVLHRHLVDSVVARQ
ncbi:hypothetical protein D5S18_17415 [Nocardia panacis]|uniref:Uncharacterized protein n=1 Tax=Nocardia panacis TaxID=2340916 RepID=A0A3A4L048_9NOCA|nr:hypothetical protein [Nocardia panacis]RJO75147.1 hypothetical protein D5S18_17415 [Nocardia panacis]